MNELVAALDSRLKHYRLHRPSYVTVRLQGGKQVLVLKTPVAQGYAMPHKEFVLGTTLEEASRELDKVARKVMKHNGMYDR